VPSPLMSAEDGRTAMTFPAKHGVTCICIHAAFLPLAIACMYQCTSEVVALSCTTHHGRGSLVNERTAAPRPADRTAQQSIRDLALYITVRYIYRIEQSYTGILVYW
jgi:hypothetical protein